MSWGLKNDQTRSETPRCYNLSVASALVWWACAGAVIERSITKPKVHGSNLHLGSQSAGRHEGLGKSSYGSKPTFVPLRFTRLHLRRRKRWDAKRQTVTAFIERYLKHYLGCSSLFWRGF